MINSALQFMKNELEHYLKYDIGDSTVEVNLGNVALFETEKGADIENKVIVSLVNLEEESTLKNKRGYHRTVTDGIQFRQQPVFLNLYLLFCSNYTQYPTALQRLSLILAFFQNRKNFTIANAMAPQNQDLFKESELDFSLTFELYTLTFEQINHLWGSLGGRQLPSVMYKARLVKIEDNSAYRTLPPIEEIEKNIDSVAP